MIRALSHLYFIQEGQDGLIKIGCTASDPEKRRRALQPGNGRPLRLIGYLTGFPDLERDWHQRWADLRLVGEWFTPAPELVSAINDALATADVVTACDVDAAEPKGRADVLGWLRENNLTIKDLAKSTGYSVGVISSNLTTVNPRFAAKIERATGGAITAASLLRGCTAGVHAYRPGRQLETAA